MLPRSYLPPNASQRSSSAPCPTSMQQWRATRKAALPWPCLHCLEVGRTNLRRYGLASNFVAFGRKPKNRTLIHIYLVSGLSCLSTPTTILRAFLWEWCSFLLNSEYTTMMVRSLITDVHDTSQALPAIAVFVVSLSYWYDSIYSIPRVFFG